MARTATSSGRSFPEQTITAGRSKPALPGADQRAIQQASGVDVPIPGPAQLNTLPSTQTKVRRSGTRPMGRKSRSLPESPIIVPNPRQSAPQGGDYRKGGIPLDDAVSGLPPTRRGASLHTREVAGSKPAAPIVHGGRRDWFLHPLAVSARLKPAAPELQRRPRLRSRRWALGPADPAGRAGRRRSGSRCR
jgi:hypothetical protein